MTNNADEIAGLKARIEQLERRSRRTKVWGTALAGLLASVVIAGAAKEKPKSIEAESFVVKDKSGKIRAALEMSEEGPILRLIDESKQTRMALLARSKSTTLEMMTDKGKRVLLMSTKDGNPSITLSGTGDKEKEVIRLQLSGSKDGSRISLCDGQGNQGADLWVDQERAGAAFFDKRVVRLMFGTKGGATQLGAFNEQGKPQLGMTLPPDGNPAFTLADTKGRVRSEWRIRDGAPELVLVSEGAIPQVRLLLVRGESFLQFNDPKGRPRLGMEVKADGSAAFGLSQGKQPRAEWRMKKGEPELVLLDEGGVVRGVFRIESGQAILRVIDKTGKQREFKP
jgi:hypothetical protein